MDKYEYNVKSDQIKKLYSRKEFEAAAKIADEIDWYRVKDNTMINRVADIYENTKQYEKAKEVLLIAYERSPLGRQLAYKLTILALRTKNFVEADEFYQDFVEMSPSDVSQYLLKYRIAKAKGEDIEVLIKILEAYIEVEMDERWQYELAKLYHESGEDDKCVAMCDELELWFNDGKYVDKARELKKLITGVLTEYNKRYAQNNDGNKKTQDINFINDTDDNFINNTDETEGTNEYIDAGLDYGASEDDEEDKTGIRSLAEAIVAKKAEKEFKEADDDNSEEENYELLDDNISDEEEYLDDEISAEEEARANAAAAAKEVARRAVEAEKTKVELTPEEIAANEALKAAQEAALEAQRAAELAKQLVMEAKLRAEQVKNASAGDYDKYKGMSADEISKSLETEEMLSGNADLRKKDSMIEIFEFDESKEGKVGNIGEELTKTAEIDIDEINIRLADEHNLYNTANIQAALAKSMEKLMNDEKKVRNAFEMQIDDDNNEIRPIDMQEDEDDYLADEEDEFSDEGEFSGEPETEEQPEETTENIQENVIKKDEADSLEESEKEPEQNVAEEPEKELEQNAAEEPEKEPEQSVTEEPEKETVHNVQENASEEILEEKEQFSEEVQESALSDSEDEIKEKTSESKENYYLDEDDDLIDEPTKRIDRAEINRILNASKNIYQSMPQSNQTAKKTAQKTDNVKNEDEQIDGQMTLEEVLAEMESNDSNDNLSETKEPETKTSVDTDNRINAVEDVLSEDIPVKSTEKEESVSDDKPVDKIEIRDNSKTDFQVKNHKIPDEYRGLFNDFVGTGNMEEMIADTLDNLINGFVMDGTSKTNNVIITGSAKIGKTTLGLSIIKAANRGRNRSGRKVAKVKASVLNKRGVALAMAQILGTDLIIEQAGNLMPNTIIDLMIAMKNYTEEMLIVLEDDKAAIDRMLDNAPDLKGFFSNRLDIHEMEIDDMVKIAREYAEEQFYAIDEMGELALYAKLDDISGRNPVLSIEDIQEVVDEAIAHANRFTIGKIFGKIHRNKDEMRVLSEQDFL